MKKALFLGGSKGLGLEMAKLAVAEDWKVVIAARTALECSLYREGKATALPLDLEADPVASLSHLGPYDAVIWTAGAYQEGRLLDLGEDDIRRIARNHLEGPAQFLLPNLRKNRTQHAPVHLVVVASSSSSRGRKGEGLYGTLKAAKAQFARTLAAELPESIPGSKVLLANPGGMNTPFWEGRGRDVSTFMDPAAVARLIWDAMKTQDAPFDEIHVDRQPDGSPKLARGVRPPQF